MAEGILPHKKRQIGYANQNIITVITGKNATRFQVYEHKLASQSATFLDLVEHDKNNKYGGNHSIILEDTNAETMDIVVHWLEKEEFMKVETEVTQKTEKVEEEGNYSDAEREETAREDTPGASNKRRDNAVGSLPTPSYCSRSVSSTLGLEDSPSSSTAGKTASNLEYADILGVYIFATRYEFPELQLESMKCWQRLQSATRTLPSNDIVKIAYSNLPDESPFLNMLAHAHAFYAVNTSSLSTSGINLQKSRSSSLGLPADFLSDVLLYTQMIHQKQKKRQKYSHFWCDFHDHGGDETAKETCYALRKQELAEVMMRKRKGDLDVFDDLKFRLDEHKKAFKKVRAFHPKTNVATLKLDEDYLLYGSE